MHLLIPHAAPPGPACRQTMGSLQLPHLQAMLPQLSPAWSLSTDEDRLTPASELAHAKALGLPVVDGLVPWAARAAREAGLAADTGYALLTPCHWDIHTQAVFMADPAELQLSEEESRTLLAAMRPYFEEDGLQLHWLRADTWLVAGEVLRDLPTASLARVCNATVDDWIPRQDQARLLRRLQNEMQMLLYTHPVNDAREARRAPTVNAFWLSGTGTLDTGWTPPADGPVVAHDLASAALRDDASAWTTALQAFDAGPVQRALEAARQGQPVQLTLASLGHAHSFHTAPLSLWTRLRRRFSPLNATALLQTL
ncbi:phosphoglycerate mutase [Curvibacter sp. APW13]|uniref:phosphoglycerate mutase n=1 Tax=Curvibacter sp. APW13 TaxID=3077236 RepID=UPI0028DD9B6F|nr:phosphoglycerate mutase [Curvibacter sp. APW13]MDT8991906.1 phosphoglycerate mutase [Curvibacter sp. APW13]